VDTHRKWRCRLRQTFFGLTDEYNEGVYEEIFFLKYSGGWSFSEAYSLPLGLRRWFVQRTIKQLEMESEAIKKASNGQSNSSYQELTPANQPNIPKEYAR
jgi:hypothetical protein|tara:strand:- start:40 stop:339 length:300 start_codon:yes stop_codon:yes gene_type:complete